MQGPTYPSTPAAPSSPRSIGDSSGSRPSSPRRHSSPRVRSYSEGDVSQTPFHYRTISINPVHSILHLLPKENIFYDSVDDVLDAFDIFKDLLSNNLLNAINIQIIKDTSDSRRIYLRVFLELVGEEWDTLLSKNKEQLFSILPKEIDAMVFGAVIMNILKMENYSDNILRKLLPKLMEANDKLEGELLDEINSVIEKALENKRDLPKDIQIMLATLTTAFIPKYPSDALCFIRDNFTKYENLHKTTISALNQICVFLCNHKDMAVVALAIQAALKLHSYSDMALDFFLPKLMQIALSPLDKDQEDVRFIINEIDNHRDDLPDDIDEILDKIDGCLDNS